MDEKELVRYAFSQYGAQPEYLWKKYPDYFVLRHKDGGKWFAVVMDIPKERLGLDGKEKIFIMDVKCGPLLYGSFIGRTGVFPAYHMNKENWITLLLDGSAESETIKQLLGISYQLTENKKSK